MKKDDKLSPKARRRYRRLKTSDLVVSSTAGLLAIAASALKLFNIEHVLASATETILIAILAGIAGILLGYVFARRKEGKGDE